MGTEFRAGLFLKKNQVAIVILSIAVALVMALLSLAGLLQPETIYPTRVLRETFLPNDLVNLRLGLPLFIYILISISHKQLLAWLLLPGMLIFVIYNYTAYALGRPVDWITLLNVGLVGLTVYTLARLLLGMDHPRIKAQLEDKIPAQFSGWALMVFGAAFIALAVSQILAGFNAGTIPPLGENAVAVTDILVSAGWIAGGVLLLRSHPLGYSSGLGLLVAASFLFLGLLLFFFLAPLLVGRAFEWAEVLTVLVMGLIAFVPTGLFWRGIVKSENKGIR